MAQEPQPPTPPSENEVRDFMGVEQEHPLVKGMRQGPDGKWYLPDPHRPGKWLQVQGN